MKTPKNIQEIVSNPLFHENVKLQIDRLRLERLKRPDPRPGYRYIRTWYDRMLDDAMLQADVFEIEIIAIWEKRSRLNSEYRRAIQHVCDIALANTLDQLKLKKVKA